MQIISKPSLHRGAVALSHDASGSGPPVLLVHGWCCDRTFMAPLTQHFRAGGHSVVAVDLRGHGDSDVPAGPYAIEDFADDLARLLTAQGRERAVLVGHSMGGVIAYDLALRYPALASAVVMLDAPIAMPPAIRGSLNRVLGGLRGRDYRRVLHAYAAKAFFSAHADGPRKAALLAAMLRTPQHVVVSACEGMLAYDPGATPGRLTQPSLYVGIDPANPRAGLAPLSDLIPGLVVRFTQGSGHFCQLEAPDQVTALIDSFLAAAIPRAPGRA